MFAKRFSYLFLTAEPLIQYFGFCDPLFKSSILINYSNRMWSWAINRDILKKRSPALFLDLKVSSE